jgi:hypothetical protein
MTPEMILALPVIITLVCAVITMVTGLTAAWYWLASTRANIDPSIGKGQDGSDRFLMMQWIESVNATGRKVASLNRKAAIWTAISVAAGALTAVVGAWPSN